MLGMAKFLSKTLKPTEEGYLLADPSSSPEQYHNGTTYQTKGCAFDQGMIWESFHDVLKAADILKEYRKGGRRDGITRGLYYRHIK